MVQKSTANNISIGMIIFLAIGSIFGDWAWLFSSEGTTILLAVILPVYGVFIGIILLLQFLARKDPGEEKEKEVASAETLQVLKLLMLGFFLTGSLLSVLSVILYDPGEGLAMSSLGATLAIIGVIIMIIYQFKAKPDDNE